MNNNGFDPNLNELTYNNNTENAADTYAADNWEQTANDSSAWHHNTAAVPKSRAITAHPIRRAEQDSTERSVVGITYSYTPAGGYASTPQTPQYTGLLDRRNFRRETTAAVRI